jgi:hypothetical protein
MINGGGRLTMPFDSTTKIKICTGATVVGKKFFI